MEIVGGRCDNIYSTHGDKLYYMLLKKEEDLQYIYNENIFINDYIKLCSVCLIRRYDRPTLIN